MRDRLVAVVWLDPRVDQANTYTREEIAVRALPYFTTFGLLARDDEEVVAVAAAHEELVDQSAVRVHRCMSDSSISERDCG